MKFPDESNPFPTLGQAAFTDLITQESRDAFEQDGSNSSSSNGCGVDFVFSQPISGMALPLTGLSSVDFISDMMRSDLYVPRGASCLSFY
jgi:hypothetical protein